jgi:hypothetical protein
MAKVTLDITMSLDGFVAGPNQTVKEPLGDGVRLFDRPGGEPERLEITRVIESPLVTHLKYRVVK